MQVSESFARGICAAAVAALLIALGLVVSDTIQPRHTASAQNAGVVGIQAIMQPAFPANAVSRISATTSSSIFQDIGQGYSLLYICNNNFSGTADLEWSPSGSAPFYPIVTATYAADSTCHTISSGAYFPNLRTTVTFTSTGIGQFTSAWYTASSGPVSVVPAALGSNGPTSPISCDHNVAVAVATGTTTFSTIGPINSGETPVVCAFSYSFNGATSAGNVLLEWATASSCSGAVSDWSLDTLSTTPQNNVGIGLIRPQQVGNPYLCILNSSGATVLVNFSWASVHL